MKDYRLVVIQGSCCSPGFRGLYNEIYSHWKEMWKTTFQELDGASEVVSDNFARQNEILGVFHLNKCVAVICHRYTDFHLPSSLDDSYFSTWPADAIQSMKMLGYEALIGNQISIDPNFRKLGNGFQMKDILLWLFLRRIQSKEVTLCVGAIREDKSLDKLFVKYGARVLKQNVLQHNVPVALVCFLQNEILLEASDLPFLELNKIYENREEDSLLTQQTSPQLIRRVA